VTEASFHNIAKHNKLFSDSEFLKQCMMCVAEAVCPEIITPFENISLSRRTTVHHMQEMNSDLLTQSNDTVQMFAYFSVALCDSADTSDTAWLLIFI